MKKTIVFIIIVFSIILSGCTIRDTAINNNEDASVDLSLNPSYCQVNDDCRAIPNPSNHCYFGYFNKDASEAINEFKNNPNKMMKQDCPTFSEVYCKNNNCTAERKQY